MRVDGDQLEHLWEITAARPSAHDFRTATTGVVSERGELLVAVHSSDRRCLLIPIAPRHTLKEEIDGRAVTLRRRGLEDEHRFRVYASLELEEPDLADLFTALCVEVIERVAEIPDKPVPALRKVLAEWRALLAGARETLTPSALAGLFGELLVLRQLLSRDSGAVALWTGPMGSAQDFHRGVDAVEVKTTVSQEGRKVRIHGIDQLDLAPPGRLVLRWYRLRTGRGTSLPELADEVADMCDDPQALRKALVAYGYRETEREVYARRRFEVVEERTYDVGPGFPRIVAATLTGDATVAGVGPVEYVIDLDSAPAEQRRLDEKALEVLASVAC